MMNHDVISEVVSNAKGIYDDYNDNTYSEEVVNYGTKKSKPRGRKKKTTNTNELEKFESKHVLDLSKLTKKERFVIEFLDRYPQSRKLTIEKICDAIMEDISILDDSVIEIKGTLVSLTSRESKSLKKEIEKYDNSVIYFLSKEIDYLKQKAYLNKVLVETKVNDGYQIMFNVN